MEQAIGHAAVKPHQRVQCHDAKRHWARHAQCQPLGVGHGQALGEQVGQQDEQRSDDKERSQKSAGLRRFRRHPQAEKSREMGCQRTFADDAAQDGHRVQPHLHHGEIVARLLLHAQHPFGAHIALIGQLAQAQAARSGQRNFSDRKKGTRCNQQHDQQGILEHGKGRWAPERRTSVECSGRAWAALVVPTRSSQRSANAKKPPWGGFCVKQGRCLSSRAGATQACLSSASLSSPDSYISIMMSEPPMNSPFTYSCGMVGQWL